MLTRSHKSSGDDRGREVAAAQLATMTGGTPAQQQAQSMTRVAAPAPPPPQPVQVPVQQWEVRGAFRESGKEAVLVIEAATQAGAESEAVQNGLLVETCRPVQPTPPPVPPPPQPLGYVGPVQPAVYMPPVVTERTSKKFKWQMLAGFLVCVFGIFSGCLFAPLAASVRPELGGVMLVVGAICFIGGLGWAMVAKFGAWWHHG
jgi:hypothetical protein